MAPLSSTCPAEEVQPGGRARRSSQEVQPGGAARRGRPAGDCLQKGSLANRPWGDKVTRVEDEKEPKSPELKEKRKEQVLKLLGHDNMARITSSGIADMSWPAVRGQVEAKHPPRAKEIQTTVLRKVKGKR